MDDLFTSKRSAQYRGPTTSDDYNKRIEENYRDLLFLMNKAGVDNEHRVEANRYLFNNIVGLSTALESWRSALYTTVALIMPSSGSNNWVNWGFQDETCSIDYDTFVDTSFFIPESSRCTEVRENASLVLPEVADASSSKLKMENEDGTSVLPSSFFAVAEETDGSVGGSVNTNDISEAILGGFHRVWERNISTTSATLGDSYAECYVYIAVPTDMALTRKSNTLVLTPYPIFSVDIRSIEFTTANNPTLTESDGWEPLNYRSLYEGDSSANGSLPPGAYDGDQIFGCGPQKFFFDPIEMTGMRIKIRQQNPFYEGGTYVFVYGIADIDLRYTKHLDQGRAMIRIDAVDGQTFSDNPNIEPVIYNVSQAELPYVFSHRVIWEAAPGSYTLDPVPLSDHIWVEVTLSKTVDGGTPELLALKMDWQ